MSEVMCDQRVSARTKGKVRAAIVKRRSRAGGCRGENAEAQKQNLQ